MNKKGQEGFALIIFFLLVIGVSFFVAWLFLAEGRSKDIAYGLEETKFWSILYLKDDHKTAYCIERNSELEDLARDATDKKLMVEVEYKEYLIRGSLCSAGEKYNHVVVQTIEVAQ